MPSAPDLAMIVGFGVVICALMELTKRFIGKAGT